LVRIQVSNRGPEAARLHVLPTLWFRNTWSWSGCGCRPSAKAGIGPPATVEIEEPEYGQRWLYCDDAPELLFTENDTNGQRLFGVENRSSYVKDSFHRYLVEGAKDAVNPALTGTKVAAHYTLTVGTGETAMVRLRLTNADRSSLDEPFGAVFEQAF